MTDDRRTIGGEEFERLARRHTSAPASIVLVTNTGERFEMTRPVVVGRDPVASADHDVWAIRGDLMLSKQHALLDLRDGDLEVKDLGSSNGTFLLLDGTSHPVGSERWVAVPEHATIEVGDHVISVARDVATAAAGAAPTGETPATAPPTAVISTVPGAAPTDPAHDQPPNRPPSRDPVPTDPGQGAAVDSAGSSAPEAHSPAMGRRCVTCGREIPGGAKFCDGCGTPVDQSISGPPTAAVTGSTFDAETTRAIPTTAPAPASPSTDGSGRNVRTGLVVGAVVLIVVLGVLGLRALGGDDSSPGATDFRVPTEPEERWSAAIDGSEFDFGGDGDGVFAFFLDDDRDATVRLLDPEDGGEVWESRLDRDQSAGGLTGRIDDIVIAQACAGPDCTTFGIDADSGETVWSARLDGFVITVDGSLLTVEADVVELYDPEDGRRIDRVRGDAVGVDGTYVYTRDLRRSEVEVFDIRTLQPRFGPVEVDDDIADVTFDGRRLITAVDDELLILESDGSLDRASRVAANEIFQVENVGGGLVVVETSAGVLAVEPDEGRAEEVWSEDGTILSVHATDAGPMVFVADDDRFEVIDAASGDVRLTAGDLAAGNRVLWFDGLAVAAPARDGWESTAYEYAGEGVLWEIDAPGFPVALGGALLTQEFVEGGVDVTFYR